MAKCLAGLLAALGVAAFVASAAGAQQASVSNGRAQGIAVAAKVSSKGSFEDFLAALRHRESRGNYRAVNTLNFLGAYQFGEAALIDLGYVRFDSDIYDNNFSGGFTGKQGITSVQDFLNNPAVQDRAANAWMRLMWNYIEGDGLDRHAWKQVGTITMTPSGMLAATHLLGSGALKDFVQSGGRADIRDPYGMPLATYISDLGGYDVPFGPDRPDVVAALN